MSQIQDRLGLRILTERVVQVERALKKAMRLPETSKRRKRIVDIMTYLAIGNQLAMHNTLGYSWKKIRKIYRMRITWGI
jgi:hypothetical protein